MKQLCSHMVALPNASYLICRLCYPNQRGTSQKTRRMAAGLHKQAAPGFSAEIGCVHCVCSQPQNRLALLVQDIAGVCPQRRAVQLGGAEGATVRQIQYRAGCLCSTWCSGILLLVGRSCTSGNCCQTLLRTKQSPHCGLRLVRLARARQTGIT